MNTLETIHPDVAAAMRAEGLGDEALSAHYSDAYIACRDWAQAARLRSAGPWRSMASTFKNEVTGKPSVDIPFAFLGAYIAGKAKP